MAKEIRASKNTFLGNYGVNFVKMNCEKNNILCESLSENDYGEDISCDICIGRENGIIRTNMMFRIQVKTTEKINSEGYIRKTKKGISFSLERNHLEYWNSTFYPVVLILVDKQNEIAYWDFPIKQYKEGTSETISVIIPEAQRFDDIGINKIKIEVEKYYNKLINLNDVEYLCKIYPVWMNKYRLMTNVEMFSIFKENIAAKFYPEELDILPSFLTTYNNCSWDNTLCAINFKLGSKSLEEFIEKLNEYLKDINIKNKKSWLSFVISPINIVSKRLNKKIEEVTPWESFSLINGELVSNVEYTYKVKKDYYYTQKIRGLSGDEDFFIHKSGNYVINIEVEGFRSHTRKRIMEKSNNEKKKLIIIQNKNIVELDILCKQMGYMLVKLNEDISLIKQVEMSWGDYGTLYKGISTWRELDEEERKRNKLKREIKKIGIKILNEKETLKNLLNYNIIDVSYSKEKKGIYLQYSQILDGELLSLDRRCIQFISYINLNMDFEEEVHRIYIKYKNIFNIKNLKFELRYEHFEEGISTIMLEIEPKLEFSTNEIVCLFEKDFNNMIKDLHRYSKNRKNMANFVKFELQRYFSDEVPLVIQNIGEKNE